MRSTKGFTFCILAVLAGSCFADTLFSNLTAASTNITFLQREDAYRENNIGVAYLEQFEPAKAVEAFRRALKIDPELKIAQTNLAIALFNAQEIDAARVQADGALKADPNRLQLHYLLGLIARNQNRTEDAVEFFQRVLKEDPQDVGTNVNLGQILMQQRKFTDAVAMFRIGVRSEPYNSTAVYNLATALLRSEQRAEGQEMIDHFQALRQSGAATSIGQNYLEQGRYAEAITSTGAEPELVSTTRPAVEFRIDNIGLVDDGRMKSRGSGAALFDFDNDGDLDVARYNARLRRIELHRNKKGKFTNVSRAAGNTSIGPGITVVGIVAGDYNNDTFDDLLVFGQGQISLFANDGKGKFKNVSLEAKLPIARSAVLTAAFADSDHDGDLDILLGGSSQQGSNVLLRNNGDGTFVDVSTKSKVNIPIGAKAIIPTDYDNRRDIDLLVLNSDGRPVLLRNSRDGSFSDVSAAIGLDMAGKWTSAAAADVNKDSYADFFFGREDGVGIFALSDGRGKFKLSDAPRVTQQTRAAQFLDYDNDGLVDLIVATPSGISVVRNIGSGWTEIEEAVARDAMLNRSQSLLSGDIDGDGDIDLIVPLNDGTLRFLRNVGGETNNAEIVRLKGRVSNRSGVGSKIDLRSGSLSQKVESYSASPMPAPSQIHFGLGRRVSTDVIRMIWPSGIVQAEIRPKVSNAHALFKPIEVEELDRKPSSCPYLYTWNGERFEFITDFLGGGEMGNWQAEGAYHFPDSDEYVRIPSDKLVAKDGMYELRVTNELEEVLFLDHLKLIAVEHDSEVEVYPNEGLGIPTAGKRILYTVRNARPPKSAIDGSGKDVLKKIASLDRTFYDSFEHTSIRGYSKPHSLTLDLDERKGFNGRTILLLTGWTDYAFSSDNVAASQSGRSLFLPRLEVKDRLGNWKTVIESIGISVGRPQTIAVDLTGKFLSDSRQVRIVTNVKTYWDKVEVDTSEQSPVKETEIKPSSAELSERGFSKEARFGGMIVPDYSQIVNDGRWKYFSGRFTKLGDVRVLLDNIDDIFVISKTGDELTLRFKPPAPAKQGRKFTFLLFADGYSKEMDINSGSPEAVFPLPFKGMLTYPYDSRAYPWSPDKQAIYDQYTTRLVNRRLPSLEASLLTP